MFQALINKLEECLQKSLPGECAQLQMAPEGRNNYSYNGKYIRAGVLLLLFPVQNEPWFILMKRPEYNGAHSGQISLPGGKYEPLDVDIQQTALRETSEELGISTEKINILGKLTNLKIPISGFEISPFVGYANSKPKWNPDKSEVDKLIEVPLKLLFRDSTTLYETWNLNGSSVKVPFYLINNEKVWGATAMILSEFAAIIKNNKLATF